MTSLLWIRASDDVDDNDDDGYWNGYYSPQAEIIRWSIVAVILLLLLAYFLGGYLHAQRRMNAGLPPLAYHRFLVSRRQRARFEPQPAFSFYQQGYGGAYAMGAYPLPPPPYAAQHPPPPQYQPPDGGSKVNPDQQGPPTAGTDDAVAGASSATMQNVALSQPPHTDGPAEASLPPRTKARPGLLARLNPLKSRA